MAKYQYHRVDANSAALYDYAEGIGFTVQKLGTPTDCAVSIFKQTAFVEVKVPKKKLRASQEKFIQQWPGWTFVWRTEADVDYTKSVLLKASIGK